MMTSKKAEYKLYSLLFETKVGEYDTNLRTLLQLIKETPKNSLIVAPEVCLSGFDYENYDAALAFCDVANEALKEASDGKIIILTMLERRGDEVFNFAKIFYNSAIIFERAKARLFRFGEEHKYMSEGSGNEVQIVTVDGIKIGILVCFELRFKEFWQRLEGCDVIAVPSWWGVLRTEHFRVLSEALAVINQCYVVASDSLNTECTKLSGIVRPHGEVERNGARASLECSFDKKEIVAMRRYMDVGIG